MKKLLLVATLIVAMFSAKVTNAQEFKDSVYIGKYKYTTTEGLSWKVIDMGSSVWVTASFEVKNYTDKYIERAIFHIAFYGSNGKLNYTEKTIIKNIPAKSIVIFKHTITDTKSLTEESVVFGVVDEDYIEFY